MRLYNGNRIVMTALHLLFFILCRDLASQVYTDREFLIKGEMLLLKGKYDEAIESLRAVQGSSLRLHYLMGAAHQYQGNADVAVEHYRKALTFSEDEKSMLALSHLGLGQTLFELEQYPQALEVLQVVVGRYYGKLSPVYPRLPAYDYLDQGNGGLHCIADDAQLLIGKCYEKTGQPEKAAAAFANLGRFFPFSNRIMEAENRLRELQER